MSLAFAAGIMLVASFTSLILPALEISSIKLVIVGIILGYFIMYVIEKYLPHEHFLSGYEGPEEIKTKLKKWWLIIIAIIIHNFAEGLAIGTSLAYESKKGIATALAIGIQDIPEGTAVVLPLITGGYSIGLAIIVGFLSGLSELITALLGYGIFSYASYLLPLGLSMAGSAMLYVVSKEMFPEIYHESNKSQERYITFSFLIGFIVMLILDSIFG
ncbi:MAG: ZIP family metal transporter [Candidatus Nanohaloarchaeota archaeon]|nr:ZIP family metal transporter [Candidatus Nanohaloarchaeota archaeon]